MRLGFLFILCIIFLNNYYHIILDNRLKNNRSLVLTRIGFSSFISIAADITFINDILDLTYLKFDKIVEAKTIHIINGKE